MEAVIFIGIQATGKSMFYKERFFDTHLRINLDMLKTRRREEAFDHLYFVSIDPRCGFSIEAWSETDPNPIHED